MSDVEPPVITMNGNNPATVDKGSTYSDLGALITDNVDYNLSIQVTGDQIDTSVVGVHEVRYNAVDNSGNHAVEQVRTVNVVDSTSSLGSEQAGSPQVDPTPVQVTEPDTATTTSSTVAEEVPVVATTTENNI